MTSTAGRLGPFRHPPFAVYWAGGVLSNLGSWLQTVAASVFVYQLTGSALVVGILNFAGFMPMLLFSVAGGVISDRFDRRQVVIWTHVASGLITLALAAATFAGVVHEAQVILAVFLINTIYAFAKPAIIAILPSLVPKDEVTDAVALNTLQFILGQILGPLTAALVMATLGAGWAFGVNALTFLGPVLAMVYLQRKGLGAIAGAAVGKGRATATSVSATSFIREQRWILALLTGVVAVSAPLEMVRTLSPALVVEGLGEPESTAGVIVAAQSVGSAIALAVFVPLRRRGLSERMVALGLVFEAVGLVGTAAANGLAMASVAVGLVGFGFSLSFPVLTGLLQTEVPDQIRGRIMAFHQMSHLGNRPVAALVVGTAATLVGAQNAALAGLLLAPIGLVATERAWRQLRERARREADRPGPGERSVDVEAEAEAVVASGP